MHYYTYYDSPVGRLLLECDGTALTGLWIENQKYYAAGAADMRHIDDTQPVFDAARAWLDEYFAGAMPMVACPPLRPRGTDFQRRVWDALRHIPYGCVMTYGDIAAKLHSAPRAVGGAIGRNPISIIIPCHRVIGTNGALTGYAGGLTAKETLLRLEQNGA
ncbi:MAG: methylated-DNA--[protein]-cysteine S-methyltransferase [Alphaproteobacteria bacterium]|nr:methylated-DNA--[protein]-cysteine S-methyltransferase [Alphaproteobacteria bacterium]